MPKTHFLRLLLASACFCMMALVGCGSSKTVTVSGKFILPKDVKLAETDSGEIRFIPEDKSGKIATAPISPNDQSFITKDITPGKYKVAVRLTPYAGAKVSDQTKKDYDTVNKAFDEATTKLTVEVSSAAEQSITIDLPKGTVTPN